MDRIENEHRSRGANSGNTKCERIFRKEAISKVASAKLHREITKHLTTTLTAILVALNLCAGVSYYADFSYCMLLY